MYFILQQHKTQVKSHKTYSQINCIHPIYARTNNMTVKLLKYNCNNYEVGTQA